jgi:hypothetical protein
MSTGVSGAISEMGSTNMEDHDYSEPSPGLQKDWKGKLKSSDLMTL